jgi:hypothetical protein
LARPTSSTPGCPTDGAARPFIYSKPLVQGPTWLRIEERTDVLRGVPDAAGNTDVVVKVTLERLVRWLDEGRLSWGQEPVKEVVAEAMGSATHRFRIAVGP